MSMNSFMNAQLRNLAGTGVYVVANVPFFVFGALNNDLPSYALMMLGSTSHIISAALSRFITRDR